MKAAKREMRHLPAVDRFGVMGVRVSAVVGVKVGEEKFFFGSIDWY